MISEKRSCTIGVRGVRAYYEHRVCGVVKTVVPETAAGSIQELAQKAFGGTGLEYRKFS